MRKYEIIGVHRTKIERKRPMRVTCCSIGQNWKEAYRVAYHAGVIPKQIRPLNGKWLKPATVENFLGIIYEERRKAKRKELNN